MCDNRPWDAHKLADSMMSQNFMRLDTTYQTRQKSSYRESMYVPVYYKIEKDVDRESQVFRPLPNNLDDPFIVSKRGNNNEPSSRPQDNSWKLLGAESEACNTHEAKCANQEYQAFNNLSKRRSGMVYFDI